MPGGDGVQGHRRISRPARPGCSCSPRTTRTRHRAARSTPGRPETAQGARRPALAAAVRAAARGETVLAATVAAKLVTSGPCRPAGRLTPRELDVLRCIAAGRSNPETGRLLFISETTVKSHVTRIFEKLFGQRPDGRRHRRDRPAASWHRRPRRLPHRIRPSVGLNGRASPGPQRQLTDDAAVPAQYLKVPTRSVSSAPGAAELFSDPTGVMAVGAGLCGRLGDGGDVVGDAGGAAGGLGGRAAHVVRRGGLFLDRSCRSLRHRTDRPEQYQALALLADGLPFTPRRTRRTPARTVPGSRCRTPSR